MLKTAISSFFNRNVEEAREVLEKDDEVDELHRNIYSLLHRLGRENKITLEQFSGFLMVSKDVERIADLSTNIAEDVIFAYEAKVIRHNIEETL